MKKLSRVEMKNVVGGVNEPAGGSCCSHSSDWSTQLCGLSKDDAIFGAAAMGGLWCCASCAASQAAA